MIRMIIAVAAIAGLVVLPIITWCASLDQTAGAQRIIAIGWLALLVIAVCAVSAPPADRSGRPEEPR